VIHSSSERLPFVPGDQGNTFVGQIQSVRVSLTSTRLDEPRSDCPVDRRVAKGPVTRGYGVGTDLLSHALSQYGLALNSTQEVFP
jgi:hypothetical protein